MNIINGILEIKNAVKTQNDEPEPIKVINGYNMFITERLIEKEHERMINIHNLDNYLTLRERNEKRFEELNNWLKKRNYKQYQLEVVKEIALNELYKHYTLNEIESLIKEHERNPNKRRF